MFSGQSQAELFNAAALLRETEKAGEKAARKSAKLLANLQSGYISRGVKPDGSAQQANVPAVVMRKKGKPSLWDTGRLMDASKWRIRNNKADGAITLRPPKDRELAIAINRTRGYLTILDQDLPPSFVESVSEILAKEMTKATAKVRPKKG